MMTSLKHTVDILLIIYVYGIPSVWLQVIPQDPSCQKALGMEDGTIKDQQLTALDNGHHPGKEAHKARLNGGSAYCTISIDAEESFFDNVYLEVDLIDSYKISGFAIQGYNTYGYGKYMRLWKSEVGPFVIHKYNGSDRIPLPQYDEKAKAQYLAIEPAFASKLKIQLLVQANIHCIRFEIYGCSDLEYHEYGCKSPQQPLLQNNYNQMEFTESDAVKMNVQYKASYLVFSKLNGWCLRARSKSDTPYSDWARVDFKGKYLIYGIQVRGFLRRHDDKDKMQSIAQTFRFQYSLDDKVITDVEASKVTKEMSSSYYGTRRNFTIPLIARFIYLRMKTDPQGNLTCIKLEVYGCDAKLYEGVATSPPVNPTNSTNPNTARIHSYHIFQGNEYSPKLNWVDHDYDGKEDSIKALSEGKGCLTDSKSTPSDNPFISPKCWLGWKKNITERPNIYVVLTRPVKVGGILIRTFVNSSMGARPFKRIVVSAGIRTPVTAIGWLCSPDNYYNQNPRVIDYYISLNDIDMQYLNLDFEYAGLWILVRQIKIIKPGDMPPSALKMSGELTDCVVPIPITGGEASARQVTVIVIIVLVLLLLILVAFIIHHYRSNLHKVWKNRSANSILVQDQHSLPSDRFITSDPQRNNQPYTKVQYTNTKYNKINNEDEEIYAAVNGQTNSFDSGVLSDQQITYADCEDFRPKTYSPSSSHNNTPNGTMLYSVPDTKQYAVPDAKQYAQPDTIKRNSIIYQGSNIYAPKYENPYKATVASSLYAEPSKLSKKGHIKIFPRNQLVFKEKIGVGQFGEVHIAEATGLDEIYGTVGHFNSWGLPDTAKVAVKLLKSVDSEVEKEFMKEVEVMATLKDENVVRLLGVCHEQPKLMVVEYMENGDLNQFLRDRKPDLRNCRTSQIGPNVLILDQLLHMAQQISAGMKYLHSVGFIHRDLATRNCLVGPAFQVKIADFGMSRYVYTKHYYRVEGKAVLPIRWMAPECLYYGKFTVKTDVWSFGVTLWEIFTFARDSPYADLNDPQVIEAACDLLQNPNRTFPYLIQPESCPNDIYELMQKCWTTLPKCRPDFICLHKHLTDKCGTSEVSI